MRKGIRGLCCGVFPCAVVAASFLEGNVFAQTDSDRATEVQISAKAEKPATPMTDQATPAPYAVRFRITGFLARQHAREGNHWRSLVEFYSMLNVDDPAWPDDEQGDSQRIARDIEVAQMMTEVGIYDHAIRILQTSLILACVNQDPQLVQVQFQMQATADLAKLKAVAVPDIDMSFLANYEPIRPANADSIRSGSDTAAKVPLKLSDSAGDAGPALTAQPIANSAKTFEQPNELPRRSQPAPIENEVVSGPLTDSKLVEDNPEERSMWSWLSRSRWRQKKEIAPAGNVQTEVTPERPKTSPAMAPTYCQECNGLHGGGGNVVVRYNPRTGITHTHIPANGAPSAMPSPYQKQFEQLQSEDGQVQRPAAPATNSARIRRGIATESSNSTSTSSATTRSDQAAAQREQLSVPTSHSEVVSKSDESVAQTSQVEPAATQDGPALSAPPITEPATRRTEKEELRSSSRAPRNVAQVGVAGDVSNPGIFALQGGSTTLAALLRRTGEQEMAASKKARILRAVEVRDAASGELIKDFYCQRLDSIRVNTESMETPIYNQELVIVDGAGEKPIYLAVMPHFILQVPVDSRSKVTTAQIIGQLSAHWPNIRNQSIGVLRYEQWGSAASLSKLTEGDPAALVTLSGGDVVYIDGTSLDRSEVLAAAESIAKMAGARIRKHE